MSSEDRRPDWEFWKYLTELTILEAVTLSMDIDPKLINYRTHRLAYGEEVTKRDESPEFERRLALAIRNRTQLSRQDDDVSEMEDHRVDQPRFSIVALSWNWKIPPEMEALAEPDRRDAEILKLKQQVEALTQERDTWKHKAEEAQKQLEAGQEHYSENLSTLIQAATKFWATAKRDRPDTQPEKDDVVAWLMKMGFLSTLADKGSTIIRPEWAHTGRKPKE